MIELPRGVRPDKGPAVERGDGESTLSFVRRAVGYLDALANKSEVSFRWYTHTNPAGCWICDTFTVAYSLARELDRLGHELEDPSGELGEISTERPEIEEESINSEANNKDS